MYAFTVRALHYRTVLYITSLLMLNTMQSKRKGRNMSGERLLQYTVDLTAVGNENIYLDPIHYS